jgi:hypothetical protein
VHNFVIRFRFFVDILFPQEEDEVAEATIDAVVVVDDV